MRNYYYCKVLYLLYTGTCTCTRMRKPYVVRECNAHENAGTPILRATYHWWHTISCVYLYAQTILDGERGRGEGRGTMEMNPLP